MAAMGFKPRIRNPGNLRMLFQEFCNLQGVITVFFILRGRVSSPRVKRNELKGEMHAPVSLTNCTLAFAIKEAFPKASLYFRPWYPGSGSQISGNFSGFQSKFPESTITPPIEVP